MDAAFPSSADELPPSSLGVSALISSAASGSTSLCPLQSLPPDDTDEVVRLDDSGPLICEAEEALVETFEAIIPRKGQLFGTVEEFEKCYKNYAHHLGFSVRSSTATKNKNGELKYKYFVCSKEGFKVKKTPLQMGEKESRKICDTRVGCMASAGVRRTEDGKYVLFIYHEEHNHTLCTPRKKHFLRSNRKLTDVQKNLLDTLGRVNVGPTKAFHIMKEQVGGYENVGFTCLDAKNYARDLKALIADSDAQIFIQNLKNLQQRNHSFYYAYELDAEDHLNCVFWSDGIARNNYSMFGDLLSFDTTYNTNKYSMIFAPFTGLNHHRLSISFGAALLANEKTESFAWLFEKFLECMGGNEPVLVVTDQDPAMRSAIPKYFKNTKHRFCMWHIMKKLSEKVGGILNANKDFQRRFKACVWNSETPDEFETKWYAILSDFELTNNDWLLHMFDLRKMWISAYLQDIPLSGLLRTTSRSESENSFFGNFLNNKIGLVEFYSRFDNAMEAQRQRELKAEHDTLNGKPDIKTSLSIEKHVASLYTHKNFYIFQEELWASCIGCGVKRCQELNDSCIFTVIDSCNPNDRDREVVYSLSNTTCSCKMFETQGIPCRHILVVLKGQGITELPTCCVTPRWSKLATSKPIFQIDQNIFAGCSESERRRKLISSTWTQLSRCMEIAKLKDESLIDLRNSAIAWENRMHVIYDCEEMDSNLACPDSQIPTQIEIFPPSFAKTKGSGKRLKSGKEKSIEIKQKPTRLCRNCGEHALHDSRNCPKKSP